MANRKSVKNNKPVKSASVPANKRTWQQIVFIVVSVIIALVWILTLFIQI